MASKQQPTATKPVGTFVNAKVPAPKRRDAVLAATDRVKSQTPVDVNKLRDS